MVQFSYETLWNPPADAYAILEQGLHNFNLAKLGAETIYNYAKLVVTVSDEAHRIIGGLHGDLYWEWFHIQTLWIDETYRGQQLGTQVLALAEEAAISKDFYKSHLETTDFQALGFYLKNGYEIFGQLEGKPTGHTWYYLKKELAKPG